MTSLERELLEVGRQVLASEQDLYSFCRNGALASLLCECKGSEEMIGSIARSSYVHVNGFKKIVLAGDSTGQRVRLHEWLEECVDPDAHDHSWFFRSLVVAGQIWTQPLRESRAGNIELEKYLLERLNEGAYRLEPAGKCRVAVGPRACFSTGEGYSMSVGEVHWGGARAGSLSLVFQGPVLKSINVVYRRLATANLEAPKPARLADDEIVAALARAVAFLSSFSSGVGSVR